MPLAMPLLLACQVWQHRLGRGAHPTGLALHVAPHLAVLGNSHLCRRSLEAELSHLGESGSHPHHIAMRELVVLQLAVVATAAGARLQGRECGGGSPHRTA